MGLEKKAAVPVKRWIIGKLTTWVWICQLLIKCQKGKEECSHFHTRCNPGETALHPGLKRAAYPIQGTGYSF